MFPVKTGFGFCWWLWGGHPTAGIAKPKTTTDATIDELNLSVTTFK
jgi:hypothetical protein